MPNKNYSFLLTIILSISIFTSCQKGITDPNGNADDNLKDSVLLYTRELYLWYNQIPASFNPRIYADPDKIMTAIRQYSNEPGFPTPVDRWSFAMTQADWKQLSSGVSVDFGFGIFFLNATDLRVTSVQRESPAGKAGISRSWKIMKINGSSNIINATSQTNLDAVIDAVYYSNSTSFTFQKPDGTIVDIVLNAAIYQEHPVILDTVYNISNKKIGYMVLDSFLGDTIEAKNEYARIASKFSGQNIDDIIVDLRYNGGGYVNLQSDLANYLAPQTADGGKMFTYQFNDKHSSWNETEYFKKAGSLNLGRIFFIVTGSTASASELLINNLKPYMDVKLIGSGNTHGKPVGFFPQPVGNWYIFPVSFRTVNKNGDANYFNGLTPDSKLYDGVDKAWGDITESDLASAIKFITTGSFRLQTDQTNYDEEKTRTMNVRFAEQNFKGMVGTKKL